MLSFSRSIALLFLTLSAAALATPHGVHNVHHHRSVAAHMVAPVPREPIVAERSVKRRRSNGRCVQKHASESNKKPASTAAPNGGGSSSNSVKPTEQLKNPAQPKSTEAPKATGAPAPDPPKGSGGGGDSGGSGGGTGPTFTGQGTFYDTGLGACGITNHNSDHIVAVSHLLFDTFPGFNGGNPNNNPVCNKQIIASRNGKSTTVTVTDRCAACQMHDLDFAPAAFNDIADPALGRVSITWRWA